jgi:TIGR03009 family protein
MVSQQSHSFAQNTYPSGGSGVVQPGATGVYNPSRQQPPAVYQPPTTGVPTGGYPNTSPPTTPGMPATGPAVTGTTPQTNHMMDRPLGTMPNGPQPGYPTGNPTGNPPQTQNTRQILPPPAWLQITKEKQEYIDRFLAAWHEQSKNIEALDYEFTRREYTSFGVSECYGRVKFRAPDKGLIEIDSELINGKKISETNKKMKVICTGEAVYEFNFADKKLTEFIIPAEQRGKGVMDSPLMILVGANPRELQERFYLDVFPPPSSLANCVCLQAWPKWLEDSKEFKYVTLAIDRQTLQAKMLLLFEPGSEDYKGFEITEMKQTFWDKLRGPFSPKKDDEFERKNILAVMPRGWAFETKNDFLPEASGQQRIAQQQPYPPVNAAPAPVSPHYGNQPTMPFNNPVNNTINNTVAPGTGATGYTGGVMPQHGIPNNNQPRPTNQHIAMPPQGIAGSQSVMR